jgi:hypothetical protein
MEFLNNSNEMKTVVETFVIEETASLIYDNEQLDSWNLMVKELGLTGQTAIQTKEKSPIPFMHLKESLKNIFECLCPRRVNIEDYNITPIPVEILELVMLSKRENYFHKIQIWYDDKSPDPVCLGVKYGTYYSIDSSGSWKAGYSTKEEAQKWMDENGASDRKPYPTNEQYYLLGKWADVKHSFEELKEMAIKRFMAEEGNTFRKQIKEAQRGLDDLETSAFDKFN